MKIKPILLFCACLFLVCSTSFAQKSSVNVDQLTGAGSVYIPIYTVSSGQVSVPVGLAYSGTGVKPKDVEGTAGMGWNIQAGGQVSRVVRGLPDDVIQDNAGNQRLGWMNANDTAANKISGFTITNDGSTCSKETTDISYITANFPFRNDTEPDLFYVSAPGLSCEMVYDRAPAVGSPAFHPVTYQDLVITYTTDPTTHTILSFTITTDKGIIYSFASPESVYQITDLEGGTPNYFSTKYYQYINGINYCDAWNLTSITDPNGNGVTFSYTPAPPRGSTDPVILFMNGSGLQNAQYYVVQSVGAGLLNTIGTFGPGTVATTYLTFNWGYPLPTGQTCIQSITGMGRNFQFNYNRVVYPNTGYIRGFLGSFTDVGCSTPINYQFGYIGQTYDPGTFQYSTTLPDSASGQSDYWGYYSSNATAGTLLPTVYVLNPAIPYYPRYVIAASGTPGSGYSYATITNSNRAVTTTSVATGSLNKISYAQGGNTNIVYESNDYYDPVQLQTMEGGGVRVKQVIDSAGTGSTNNIIRNYTYTDPVSGHSSGAPLTLPQFAFVDAYGGSATGPTLWKDATVLSLYDLSPDDHTIMYSSVKESQTGAGSTVYTYSVPENYWTITPTLNYIGRNYCSNPYGPIKNYQYTFPFIPNQNYEFDRGQLLSAVSYNDTGAEVSESDYTYTQSFVPTSITALRADDGGPSLATYVGYNKYIVTYASSLLTASVTKKVYDSGLLTTPQTSTVNYTYASTHHKLVTLQSLVNSDLSTVNTTITYTKDLTAATSPNTNVNIAAIKLMQLANINVPVETYQQAVRGGTTTTMGASMTLFRDTTVGSVRTMPSRQLKWVQSGTTSFTPMTISGTTLTKDAGYFTTANFDIYDYTMFPRTVDDGHKNIQTTVLDHFSNQPTAIFKNAAYNQIAFSDFDNGPIAAPSCAFNISGSQAFVPTSSHAGNAYGLGISQTITQSVVKNALAVNYIFSIWINAVNTGSMSVTLNGGTPYTISYTGTGAGSTTWVYHEVKMSLAGLTSPLSISCSTTANIAIDDLLLYPDVAEATTATYDATAHYKIAQTNTNGVSAYFTNDEWGRTLFAFDQDKNIVQKNSFFTPADVSAFITPTFYHVPPPPTIIDNVTLVTFTANQYSACTGAGLTYNWNFGDGNKLQTITYNTSHTYTTPGTYYANLTVSSPLFGSKAAKQDTIVVDTAKATLTLNNYTVGGGIATITMTSTAKSYSFTGSDLPTTVLPGTYSITVTPAGQAYNPVTGKGMTNIVFSDAGAGYCFSYGTGGSHTFTWTVIAHHTLNFSVYNNNYCPFE